MSGTGFPVLTAIAAVMIQAATGIIPDTKPTPPPLVAPVAAIAVPAPPASAPVLPVIYSLPSDFAAPVPKPRPKPPVKAASKRKHKPAPIVRRAPPAPPAPVQWSVSIRLSL